MAQLMSAITTSIPRTITISKTIKSYLAIAGIVLIQLVAVVALTPTAINIWRAVVCPSC